MLSRAGVRSLHSARIFSQAERRGSQCLKARTNSIQLRQLCARPNSAGVPPPPPAEGGGGGGAWVLILAALGGGGYYFRDEIQKQLGMESNKSEPALPEPGKLKEELAELEAKLPKAEKAVEKTAAVVKEAVKPQEGPVDYKLVRAAIADILDEEDYDDGSIGPLLVRLAWHSAGTFDKSNKKGGSEGAGMRFASEAGWGANAGLDVARAKLEPVKAKFPGISYADLWSLAGTTAIEEMGGPDMGWRAGRKDHDETQEKLPDGLLPDADGRDKPGKPSDHLRDIFNRMGFSDKEIVCLSGAHVLGRCHENRSGYWGPWSYSPTTFSNEYFRLLLEERWSKKKTHKGKEWKGPEQYETENGELMMLPTDMSLVWDDKLRPHVEKYAKNEELFFKDFKKAWMKLQENGVRKFHGTRRYYFFGPRE